jgi:hypothetical protein
MKTIAAIDARTFRLIGAALVLLCLFLSFAGFASIPLATTVTGQVLWSVFAIANLIVGVAVLVELAVDCG